MNGEDYLKLGFVVLVLGVITSFIQSFFFIVPFLFLGGICIIGWGLFVKVASSPDKTTKPVGDSPPEVKSSEIKPPELESQLKEKVWAPEPISITIGVIMIVSIYLLPIFPISTLGFRKTVSLSQYIDYCNNPLFRCEGILPFFFYLIWIVAIIFIISGFFTRERKST